MKTIVIVKETKASKSFVEFCKTLPFVEVREGKYKNQSPSGCIYFNDKKNIDDILESAQQIKKGKGTILTPQLKKKLFEGII